ncbi:unnamed protein product [Brassica oleracea]
MLADHVTYTRISKGPEFESAPDEDLKSVAGPPAHKINHTSYIGASSDIGASKEGYLCDHEDFGRETTSYRFSTQPEHAANWFHTKRSSGLGDTPFTSQATYTASELVLFKESNSLLKECATQTHCLAIETACGIRLFFFVVDCGISQHPVLSEIIIITPIQLGVCSGLDNSVNNGLKFNNGLKESEFFIHLKCIFRDYIVVDIIGAVSNLNLMLSLSGLTSTHDGFLMLNLKAKFTIPIDNGDALKNAETDSQRTLYPYVTGTSIVAIKYKEGVLMASDMGGSYGSTLRYKNIERVKAIGKHSLLGASGEISDFQEILRYLDELVLNDNMWDDGNSLGPKEVHNYLTRVMYNRRNKFNPLWNTLVLGGVKNGQSYLGMVSMIGVSFEDNHVATGFGNHLARPILRDEWHADLSFEDGVKLLEKCMRVLLYRDRSAINKLQISKITEEGVTVSQLYSLKTFWEFQAFHNPTAGAQGSW